MSIKVKVGYFAALRDQRGLSSEEVSTSANSAAELYQELAAKHKLTVESRLIRFVKLSGFCEPDEPLVDGDEVEFLPPASGG